MRHGNTPVQRRQLRDGVPRRGDATYRRTLKSSSDHTEKTGVGLPQNVVPDTLADDGCLRLRNNEGQSAICELAFSVSYSVRFIRDACRTQANLLRQAPEPR